MTRLYSRKTNPAVVGGRVRKKNRHALTPTYWNTLPAIPAIDRERPGIGYRHLLQKRDVLAFIDILPEWEEISRGLAAVLLSRGRPNCEGWYDAGVVGICAWERFLWQEYTPEFYDEHVELFAFLHVPSERTESGYLCKFTDETARAYQLLHVFLHELGHHHDKMSSKRQRSIGRGEPFAERYAHEHGRFIWDRYANAFKL